MLDTELIAAGLLRHGAAIPLFAAACGGASAAWLGRTIAVYQDQRSPKYVLVVGGDVLAMVAVIGSLVLLHSRSEIIKLGPEILTFSTLIQVILALIAFKLSADIVWTRPGNGRQSGQQTSSRNLTGFSGVAASTAERRLMPSTLTRQDRAKIVALGRQQYESLRAKLERAHSGQRVAISVKTGRFTTEVKGPAFTAFSKSLADD